MQFIVLPKAESFHQSTGVPMPKQETVEKHFGMLFSIESIIVQSYHQERLSHDHDVIRVLEALIAYYRALATNYPLPEPSLPSPNELALYKTIRGACEALNTKETLACMKTLKKSALRWNKEFGSQGYLNYVSRFIETHQPRST